MSRNGDVMDRSKAQFIWDMQASEQSARDATRSSGAQMKFFGGVFLLLLAVWAVDQVLVQLQIWYQATAAWMTEIVSMLAGYWPL